MFLITQARVGYAYSEIMVLQFAAKELGWDVFPAPTSWRMEEDFIKSNPKGVAYGSQTFCEVISQQMGWKLIGNTFDWLAKVPRKYTKRQIDFMPLKEARLYNQKKFIKPADDKVFPAQIYEAATFNPPEIVLEDTPTLISDIVQFTSEFRCFVKDQKVQTYSCYIHNELINHEAHWRDPKIYDGLEAPDLFVNRMLEEVHSEPSVIDVGIIPGQGWAIIESNQAWASGIYGCDPIEALKVMEKSIE